MSKQFKNDCAHHNSIFTERPHFSSKKGNTDASANDVRAVAVWLVPRPEGLMLACLWLRLMLAIRRTISPLRVAFLMATILILVTLAHQTLLSNRLSFYACRIQIGCIERHAFLLAKPSGASHIRNSIHSPLYCMFRSSGVHYGQNVFKYLQNISPIIPWLFLVPVKGNQVCILIILRPDDQCSDFKWCHVSVCLSWKVTLRARDIGFS